MQFSRFQYCYYSGMLRLLSIIVLQPILVLQPIKLLLPILLLLPIKLLLTEFVLFSIKLLLPVFILQPIQLLQPILLYTRSGNAFRISCMSSRRKSFLDIHYFTPLLYFKNMHRHQLSTCIIDDRSNHYDKLFSYWSFVWNDIWVSSWLF